MTYTRLALTDFQALYPFPALTEALYAAWATKAEARVGENYGDEQQDATELLIAHLLATNSVGITSAAATLATTGATSFKSGTFSATISESVVSKRAKGGLRSTIWGDQFADIQRRLFGGTMLVGFIGTPC